MTTPTPEDRREVPGALGAQHLESLRQAFRGEMIQADHPG